MRIETGCTIFVKLQVPNANDRSEKRESVPGARLSTRPLKALPGRVFILIRTGWPGFILMVWVSLKLAFT